MTDPVIDTSLSLVTPFVAYVAAEEIHGSGVLAVVIAGLLLGHKAPVLQTATSRIAERLNWRTISFLLENVVFLLIGLQARWIIRGRRRRAACPLPTWSCCAWPRSSPSSCCRLVWVFPARFLLVRPGPDRETGEAPVVAAHHRPRLGRHARRGHAGGGVRDPGVVRLPRDADPDRPGGRRRHAVHPGLDAAVAGAPAAAAGTGPARGRAGPRRAVREGHRRRAGAARDSTTDDDDPYDTVEALRAAAPRSATPPPGSGSAARTPDEETPSEAYARLRLEMLEAEREKVLEVRSTGTIPHEVVEDVLAALDVEESMLDIRNAAARGARRGATRRSAARPARIARLRAPRGRARATSSREVERRVPGLRRARGCTTWVHLRKCLTCGHMACCDSSPRRHASLHFDETGHPVMRSAEPGEEWRWCFVDSRLG